MASERFFDVVVVGSGAGGGAAAKELAPLCREGLKVAALEWGPELRAAEHTGRELEMARRLYFGGGGVLTRDKTVSLAFARAYGGSTVVYTGTSLALPEDRLARWGVPGLEYDDLARRSRKYLEENNAHLLEPALLNDNNKLFERGCSAAGLPVRQFPVNVKDCRGGGLCNLGCKRGAKQGTHRVQLPAARRQGVSVVTNCRVTRVEERALRCVVENGPAGMPSDWPAGEYLVRARAIVLAAGAVNTPALLLRSGFGARLPALGGWFTCQPSMILVGRHEKPISNYWGHPKSFYCDAFVESEGFLLESCMYFPFTTAKGLSGFGCEHARLMSRMDCLQMILALAVDEARPANRVRVDARGEPVVDYRLSPATRRSLAAAMRAAARIFFGAGAVEAHVPAARPPSVPREDAGRLDELVDWRGLLPGKATISAAHLMGGCRMGSSVSDSVTDAWGRVHGVPWLYVADASLFPMAAGINPYVTIMALADRTAERVRCCLPDLARRVAA